MVYVYGTLYKKLLDVGAVENITGGSRYIVTALGDGCLAGVLVHQSQLGCRIDLLDS
jgi:hypothetical protein